MGVKDNTELINLVDVQSRTYATKLQGIVADLTETVSGQVKEERGDEQNYQFLPFSSFQAKKNSGNADGLINEVKTKILTTIREIEAKNPQLVTDSKKYQEEFEGQLRSVMAETEKFREKISGEGGEVLDRFSKVAKELYETTVTTATGYSTQVQEKLKEKP